jgi:hypothetical protein
VKIVKIRSKNSNVAKFLLALLREREEMVGKKLIDSEDFYRFWFL